jgi:hypothetical protein
LRLAERACAVTDRTEPECLATLAAAQAEMGNFEAAIQAAQQALALAKTSRDSHAEILLQAMLNSFRANLPYREEPTARYSKSEEISP